MNYCNLLYIAIKNLQENTVKFQMWVRRVTEIEIQIVPLEIKQNLHFTEVSNLTPIIKKQNQAKVPSKHLLVFRTSKRLLQDVFSVTIFSLLRRFETSWRHILVPGKRLFFVCIHMNKCLHILVKKWRLGGRSIVTLKASSRQALKTS